MTPDFDSLPSAIRDALSAPAEATRPAPSLPGDGPAKRLSGAGQGLSETERAARYVATIPGLAEHQGRNKTLYSIACRLSELFRLTTAELKDACRAWNDRCTPPQDERAFSGTFDSAIGRMGREGKLGAKWRPPLAKAAPNTETGETPRDDLTPSEIEDELCKVETLDGQECQKASEELWGRSLPVLARLPAIEQERLKNRFAETLDVSKPVLAREIKRAKRKAKGTDTETEGHPDYLELANRFLAENALGEPDSEVRLRYYRQEFFLWNGHHWEPQQDEDFSARLTSFLQGLAETRTRVSRNLVANVLQNLKGRCRLDSSRTVPFWIDTGVRAPRLVAMKNGLIDLDDLIEGKRNDQGELVALKPHTSRFFNVASLPYEFQPDAKCPVFHAFLSRVQPDPEVRRTLCEWLGYNLIYDTRLQRFMLLQGEGSNGKSVYSAVLKAVIGRGNYSAVSLSAFTQERSFCLVPTIGKLANIQTDLDYVAPKEEGRLKAFVSGEELEIERKNKDAVTERPTARLTFACNPPPMFRDRSRGIWRRLIYVRFREQISDDEANPDMTEEEWWAKELPGIFNLAVTGLRDLLARGRFEEPENCRIDKEEYRQELNPADIFLRDHGQLCPCEKRPCSDPRHAVWTGDLYEAYKEWLRQAGHDHKDQLSKAYFGREVRRVFSAVSLTKNARMHRVYRKQFLAGALVDSEEIETEVKDRLWEGLLFYPHGIPTAEDKHETNGESQGSE